MAISLCEVSARCTCGNDVQIEDCSLIGQDKVKHKQLSASYPYPAGRRERL